LWEKGHRLPKALEGKTVEKKKQWELAQEFPYNRAGSGGSGQRDSIRKGGDLVSKESYHVTATRSESSGGRRNIRMVVGRENQDNFRGII